MSNPPTFNISGEPPPPSSPPQSKPKSNLFSLILVGIIMISILFTFFLFLGLISITLLPLLLPSLHRHRRLHRRRNQSSLGFSSKRVKKLPQFKFSEFGNDCVVCLDEFKQGQWCRKLPDCGHVFHRKCVDSWLIKAVTCPICRTRVRFGDEDREEEGFKRCFDRRRSNLLDL